MVLKPRFSLKSFLIATIVCGAVIALQYQVQQNVDTFQAEFSSKDYKLHAVVGTGHLQWLKDIEYTDVSSPIDYVLFRRTYRVSYEASMMDNGNCNVYQCETEFQVMAPSPARLT